MRELFAPRWRETLTENGFGDFDTLWGIDLTLLDNPNRGRGKGGWSEVGLLPVPQADGGDRSLIIKRQSNYVIRTFGHPIHGIPTLRNEAMSILRFNRLGIPSMGLVYYGEKRGPDGPKAILLTEYLYGYTSLDRLYYIWQEQGWPHGIDRRRLIGSIADLISIMHARKMRHNSLYPKHIFLRADESELHCKLIDLEKVRWSPIGNARRIRDLDSLHRHAQGWSKTDRVRFFKRYCRVDRLGTREKRLLRRVSK